jgi:hypothetical protein
MIRKVLVLAILVAVVLTVSAVALADKGGRAGSELTVYVTGQGLTYDSIVTAQLPPHGPFQKLEMGPNGLQTEFGPGDVGYLGGRWWLDANGDGEMNDGDAFFLCPLLGPGQ